jgi:hypothetical protein
MFLSGSTQKSEVARADTRKRRANIQNRTSKNTNVGHRMAYLRVVMRGMRDPWKDYGISMRRVGTQHSRC